MAEARVGHRANRGFILGLLLVLGVLSFLIFAPFGSYIIMGLFLAYAVHPVYQWLEERLGDRPRVSAFLMLVLVFVIIIGPLVYVAFALVGDLTNIVRNYTPAEIRAFFELVVAESYSLVGREPPDPGFASEVLTRIVPTIQAYLTARLSTIFTLFTRLLVGLFLMAFVIFYALVDGRALLEYVRGTIPLSATQTDHLFKRIGDTVDAAFLGQIVVSIAQGTVGAIGFIIFGLPNPIFWGFVMIVLSIIPVVGAFLVWMPAGVVLMILGNTFGGVGILLWGLLPVSLIDNFLRPYLVGSRAEMHPVLVLVGVLGGLLVFGFIGFIIGPLILSLFVAVLNFWREENMATSLGGDQGEPLEGDVADPS